MSDATSQAPPLGPYLLACAAVAVCIDLGGVHQAHHGDSLLVVPISLYRWTPFYWELDRIGMLVPLLAAPFRNPLVNLLVQDGIDLFCGLAALFLLTRYVLRDGTYPVVAGLGAAAFVALASAVYRFEYFIDTFNGVWLALGLGGLVLLEPRTGGSARRRGLAALGLLVLAHWVYYTAAAYLGVLVVARGVLCGAAAPARNARAADTFGQSLRAFAARAARTETAASLLALAAAAAAGSLLRRLAPFTATDMTGLPVREWPLALAGMLGNTWACLAPQYWPAALAAGAGVGLLLLIVPAVRRGSAPALRAAAALLTAAAAVTLLLATRSWVRVNACNFRYLIPPVVFAQAALGVAALAPACRLLTPRALRGASVAAAACLFAAALYAYGTPSLGRVRADLARVGGLRAEDVLEARCTHVAGDYWRVWPAVFNANLALYERGEARVVWGISLRSTPTESRWKRVPLDAMRIAAAAGDGEAEDYCRRYGLPPLEVVEKRAGLWVLRPGLYAKGP